MTSASHILESFWNIWSQVSDFPACGPNVYTLSWKAQIHDSGHRVNFDRNLPSSCFVMQYNFIL